MPVEPDPGSAVVVSAIAVVLASVVVLVLVPVAVVLVPVAVAVDVRPEADESPIVVEVDDGPDPDDPVVVALGPLELTSLPVGWKHAKSSKPKVQSAACRRRDTRPK